MSLDGVERRLSAILSADVVGYSRLMAEDEDGTVRRLAAYREEITLLVGQHGGGIVDFIGDNFLAEFPSAVNATRCAVEIQGVLKARNASLAEDQRMEFRIGIHLGDVRVEGERIFGDGVNIAARLEGLAEPGGVCISGAVHEQVGTKLHLEFADLGEKEVKNISAPVRVFGVSKQSRVQDPVADDAAVIGGGRSPARYVVAALVAIAGLVVSWIVFDGIADPAEEVSELAEVSLREDGQTLIVVLPFENLGEEDQAYFAHGMTEAITNRLGVLPGLGVISRTSAVQYAAAGASIQQMGKDGVEYVLEGTVLRLEDEVRITPQLIRVGDDTHLWAQEYDRTIEEPSDIFDILSEIAEHVTEQLDISILGSSASVMPTALGTDSMAAYEAYLAGTDAEGRPGVQQAYLELAVQMFERAVELDPGFALAWAKLVEAYSRVFENGFDRSSDLVAKAREAAEQSEMIAPDLPETHRARGVFYHQVLGDEQRASRELQLAATGLPNDSGILRALGRIHRRHGDFTAAMELFESASRLDPRSSTIFQTLGWTATYLRQYEKADDFYLQAIAMAPDNVGVYGLRRWNVALWKGFEVAEALRLLDPDGAGADWNIYWNLQRYEDALQELDQRGDNITFDRFATLDFHRAWVYTAMGEEDLAAVRWDSARLSFLAELEQRPDDDRVHSSLGLAYAGLGLKEKALEHGRLGLEIKPPSIDAMEGPTRLWDLARIYATVGEAELALQTLDQLLSIPADFSVRILESEPFFASLREHPEYERLVARYRS